MSTWQDYANCHGVDPEVFFPKPSNKAGLRLAKAYCALCKVKQQCEDFAIKTEADEGVYGGKTPNERLLYNIILKTMQSSSSHVSDTELLLPEPSLRSVQDISSPRIPKLETHLLTPRVAVQDVLVAS